MIVGSGVCGHALIAEETHTKYLAILLFESRVKGEGDQVELDENRRIYRLVGPITEARGFLMLSTCSTHIANQALIQLHMRTCIH